MKGRQVGAAVAAGILAVAGVALAGSPAHADGTLASYRVVAQGQGFNWTYDNPTANFHPQVDNELPYAETDGDPTRAHAISSLYWPGAAGGNLGSLLAVLGYSGFGALNDPVRAEASTSSTTKQATAAPTGTTMTASVVPDSGFTQEASSTASWVGSPLGSAGSIGAVSAVAKQTLDGAGNLVATANNSMADVDIGGTFKAGSIATAAGEQSAGGGTPTLTSTITVTDLTIGGQHAYVDGSGVHMGQPGKPAGSAVVDSVSKGLAAAGMQIYFTEAAKVTIGGVAYDYAPALLVYWAPPGDTNHDVFTFGFGGAAIQMVTAGGDAGPAPVSGASSADNGTAFGGTGSASLSAGASGLSAVPPSPGATSLQLPAPSAGSAPRVLGNRTQSLGNAGLATAHSPGGIGGAWFLLLALAAIAGAVLAPRLPALLSSVTASTCANDHTTPNRRT